MTSRSEVEPIRLALEQRARRVLGDDYRVLAKLQTAAKLARFKEGHTDAAYAELRAKQLGLTDEWWFVVLNPDRDPSEMIIGPLDQVERELDDLEPPKEQ
jgi:hypothetical protein